MKKKKFIKKENETNTKKNISSIKKRCHSIKTFIENFPDFRKFYQNKDIDIIEI